MDGMGQNVSSSKNNASWNSENKWKLNGFPMRIHGRIVHVPIH